MIAATALPFWVINHQGEAVPDLAIIVAKKPGVKHLGHRGRDRMFFQQSSEFQLVSVAKRANRIFGGRSALGSRTSWGRVREKEARVEAITSHQLNFIYVCTAPLCQVFARVAVGRTGASPQTSGRAKRHNQRGPFHSLYHHCVPVRGPSDFR